MRSIKIFMAAVLALLITGLLPVKAEKIDLVKTLKERRFKRGMTVVIVNNKNFYLHFKRGDAPRNSPTYYDDGVHLYYANTLAIVSTTKPFKRIRLGFTRKGRTVLPTEETCTVSTGKINFSTIEWTGSSDSIVISFMPPDKKIFSLLTIEMEYKEDAGTEEPEKTVGSILDFKALENNTAANLTLTKAVVLYSHDKRLFVQDETGAMCIETAEAKNFKRGDIISGTMHGKNENKQGMPCITSVDKQDIRIAGSRETSPLSLAADQLDKHPCELIATSFTQGENHCFAKDVFAVGTSVYAGADIECTGIVVPHENDIYVCPITDKAVTVRFYEDKENVYGEAANVGVHIKRTLKGNVINTLALPVDMSAEEIEQNFGAGTILAEFKEADAENVHFNIVPNAIEANKPYLIIPTKYVEEISTSGSTLSLPAAASPAAKFVGILNIASPAANSFFLSKENTLTPFSKGGKLKAFRAYFANIDEAAGKKVVINNLTNGIYRIAAPKSNAATETVYSISGYRIPKGKPLSRGLYIIGKKKVLVR